MRNAVDLAAPTLSPGFQQEAATPASELALPFTHDTFQAEQTVLSKILGPLRAKGGIRDVSLAATAFVFSFA
jgi:hypothetical protein